MSTNYVEKFDCGNLMFDLPTSNLLYEIPLLQFKDMRNKFYLSLIYNREMASLNDNFFNICKGYKLNINKKLLIEGVNISFLDTNGKILNLNRNNNIYTFPDDSKRIIRFNGQNYVLEHFDYSTEVYNNEGNIIETYDKYGDLILKYNYTNNLLTSIDFKDNIEKRVMFTYSYNELTSICYIGNSSSFIKFSYPNGKIKVSHYNGVKYEIEYSNTEFTSTITETDDNVLYIKKCVIDSNHDWIATLYDYVGDEVVNSTNYIFDNSVSNCSARSSQIVITDFNGVKIRQQYANNKLLYSYELTDIVNNDITLLQNCCVDNISTFYTVDDNFSNHTSYIQNYSNGISLYPVNDVYEIDLNNQGNLSGYYILSGWIKAKDTVNPIPDVTAFIRLGLTDAYEIGKIHNYKKNTWSFFSFKFKWDSSEIKFRFTNSDLRDIVDVKLIPIVENKKNENDFFAPYDVDVLIDKNDENNIIPIQDIILSSNEFSLEYDWVSFNDVLRYKINQRKSVNVSEIYYNDNKDVLFANGMSNIEFIYQDEYYLVENYFLGKISYTAKGKFITKYDDSYLPNNLVIKNIDSNNNVKQKQKLNQYLDVIESFSDGQTQYITKDKSLTTKISINDIIKEYLYDEVNNIVTEVDEFGNQYKYYYDSTWGVLIKTELPDNSFHVNLYDQDKQTQIGVNFGNLTNNKSFTYTYEDGNLQSIQSDAVTYTYGYDKGKLCNVNRDSERIEDHVHTQYTTTSYYPSQSSPLYLFNKNFDKYNRLTSVTNMASYIYDVIPEFDDSTGDHIPKMNNSSALLAVYNDLADNTATKYKYDHYDRLREKTVTNSSNMHLTSDLYNYNEYDQINSYSHNNSNLNQTFNSTIEYDNEINGDGSIFKLSNRTKKYLYNLNLSNPVETNYSYDQYKRIQSENVFLDNTQNSKKFTTNFVYNKTRINNLKFFYNDNLYSTKTYNYDSLGRIENEISLKNNIQKNNRYKYNIFGQLVREDNQELNKSYLYNYNDYGDLISKYNFNYSLDETLSGVYSIDSFTYDISNKHQLSKYNNKTIIYDTEGKIAEYNGFVYTWNKNLLKRISTKLSLNGIGTSVIKTYDFVYNGLGQRTQMKYTRTQSPSSIIPVDGSEIKSFTKRFYYDDLGRIIRTNIATTLYDSTLINSTINFLYSNNTIIGIEYIANNEINRYYYERNIFNDVVGIYDINGNLVVKYNYDAWGKCTIGSGTTNVILANINPIRYRGYYYDDETGYFWLSSRYYSPELGRFIQPADVSSLNPSSINGLNLYSYANNNPIGIAYRSSGSGASGGMVSSIASSVGGLNSGYHGIISNSSNILGALGTLSTAFGLFDQWSGYLRGGLDAGLDYWGPEGFGFHFLGKYSSAFKKFGTGMTIAGNVLSWGSSVYNNFNNPNYSTGEAIGASFMDAAYYTGKGFGTYWLGSKVGELAVTAGIAAGSAALGATAFGKTIGFVGAFAIGGGVAVLVGIAGAVAIYYLGKRIDDGWEWLKKQIFE